MGECLYQFQFFWAKVGALVGDERQQSDRFVSQREQEIDARLILLLILLLLHLSLIGTTKYVLGGSQSPPKRQRDQYPSFRQ